MVVAEVGVVSDPTFFPVPVVWPLFCARDTGWLRTVDDGNIDVAGIVVTLMVGLSWLSRGRIGRGRVERTVTGNENTLTRGRRVTAVTGRITLSEIGLGVNGTSSFEVHVARGVLGVDVDMLELEAIVDDTAVVRVVTRRGTLTFSAVLDP